MTPRESDDITLNLYIVSRCTHNYYARELKKIGLTMGQFPFILGIAGHDGISQEKLSAAVGISKSTTAMMVRQLLDAGLAVRTTDLADRRNFRLHITAKARSLLPRIEEIIAECHRRITVDLSEMERELFARLTFRVRETSERELGRPGSGN